MSLGRNTIRKRVMGFIDNKIEEAQKEHDEKCDELDAQNQIDHTELDARLKTDKEAHASQLVQSIIGKIL